jgi:hypothetical protein
VLSLMLFGCFDTDMDLLLNPGEPVFVTSDAECWAGLLEVEALVDSRPVATNLVIEVSDEEGVAIDTLFPVNDLTQADAHITRWQGEMAHDCETPLVLTWTAYTGQQTESTKVTAWPMVAPELDAPNPPWGSDAGGSLVELAGAWLDDVTLVLFGGEEATVVSIEGDRLVLETPAHDAGPVDVVVETTGGTTTLTEAFTYYPDQSGLARGFARPTVFRYDTRWFTIGSAYAQLGAYGPFVQVDLAMIEPTEPENTFVGGMPEAGSCTWGEYDYTAVQPGSYLIMDDGDSYALSLWDNWLYTLVLDQVSPSDWEGAEFDLEFPTSADDLPAQNLTNALTFPNEIWRSADWEAENPHVRGNDLELSWTDDTTVDGLVYNVYLVKPGMQVLASQYCTVVAEDESLTVDWASLTDGIDASGANGIVVQWRFWRDTKSTFEHDNSHFWSRGFSESWTWHPLVEE